MKAEYLSYSMLHCKKLMYIYRMYCCETTGNVAVRDTTVDLRIDNRRYGPFWWRRGILDTIKALWGSKTCIIYISLAYFMAF